MPVAFRKGQRVRRISHPVPKRPLNATGTITSDQAITICGMLFQPTLWDTVPERASESRVDWMAPIDGSDITARMRHKALTEDLCL